MVIAGTAFHAIRKACSGDAFGGYGADVMEELAYTLATGAPLTSMNLPEGVEMQDNKYIRLPYEKVDKEKVDEYLSK